MKPIEFTTNPLDFIYAQPPFNCLTEAELNLTKQTLEISTVEKGVHILTQDGPPSKYLYLIREGAVRYVRDGKVIQVLEEGDLFGYPSMLNQEAASSDVIAEEKTTLYCIPEKTFRELIDNAQFAEFFLKSLSERLQQHISLEQPSLGGDLTTLVGDLIIRPPVLISPAATVAEAAQAMRQAWVDAVLVQDTPPGIVTDRDFRIRVLAEELGPETPVRQVMSRPLKTLSADTPVHGALLFMLEEDIHHVPLTQKGQVMGIVTANDILRHQAKSPLYFLRQLEQLDTTEILSRYALEVSGSVEMLFKGGLDVAQIGRVIASLNDALLRRLLREAEADLGPPPTPYAWLVFGSEGRMEQALLTDQDNALAYLEDTAETRQYFKSLTQRVINGLIEAGFPPCPGGYMATKWCYPRQEWEELFQGWVRNPNPQALLEIAIFFDFRAVHGELSLEPLERIIQEAGKNDIFLAHLTRAALEFRPPLSFFRRIRAEDGQVDLKAGGIAPVVSMARVYALQADVRSRSTFERLEAAQEAGVLSRGGAETLIETYRFLFQLRLRDQLAAVEASQPPDNKVQLEALSPMEKRHLKDAFLAIREMQEAISQRIVS
jgi:CBS domain-containing protein